MTDDIDIVDVFNDDALADLEKRNDSQKEEKPSESEEDTQTEQKEDDSRGEKEESESPADKNKETNKDSVPIAALTSEREKRQQAEKEARELREEIQKYKLKSDDVPDPEKDPDGYKKYFEDEAQLAKVNQRIQDSRDIMLDLVDDYEEMEKIYEQLAVSNPILHQQMTASKSPAKFAYQIGKQEFNKREAQKITEKEAMKAEIRAELLKEMGNSKPSFQNKPDLISATQKTVNSPKSHGKAPSHEELFADSKFG